MKPCTETAIKDKVCLFHQRTLQNIHSFLSLIKVINTSSYISGKESVPEVRDGNNNKQVERHCEQSDEGQQCYNEHVLESNRHRLAGIVKWRGTEFKCFQCFHHHQRWA